MALLPAHDLTRPGVRIVPAAVRPAAPRPAPIPGPLPHGGPVRETVSEVTLEIQTPTDRFNPPEEPEPVPSGTDFAWVVESDVPVVVQHSRLDSRQAGAPS